MPGPYLVFRGGRWISITLPFEDPMLSESQYRRAAAIAASNLASGKSEAAAMQAAEAELYNSIFGEANGLRVVREKHDTPQD